jgi:hypothetical protein
MAKSSLLGQVTLGLTAVAAIVVASNNVKPVFVAQTPVVQRLVAASWRDSAAARAPWAVRDSAGAVATAQFQVDSAAFAQDLVNTGKIDSTRAAKIATYAVREAYRKHIPPALVFGVLLTENATFRSRAKSNVGAVGLMQIYPKVWVPTLGKLFGRDLRNDETNLRYGVHILSHYVYTAAKKVDGPTGDPTAAVRTGLLRYNGCVRGTNTPDCKRYPDKVLQAVQQFALAQCGTGVEDCIAKPMRLQLDDDAQNGM